ncbi:hypothetical protein D3C72_2476240 [compost metagenome]
MRRGRYKDGVLDGKWEFWYGQGTGEMPGAEPSVTPWGSPKPKASANPARQNGQTPVLRQPRMP